jgi:hypothetical protein
LTVTLRAAHGLYSIDVIQLFEMVGSNGPTS